MKNSLMMLAWLAAVGTSGVAAAASTEYPAKAIKIIVPFSAGGFSDNVARMVAEGLTTELKVPVVVDNRPGAGGNLGASIAARAEPDGYTLYLGNVATNAINPNIYQNLDFDPAKAFVPISLVVKTANVVAVNNELPAGSLTELVSLARSEPGKLNYGTPGAGTSGHLTAEMFKARSGIDIMHIPYKGTPPVLADLMGGQLQLTFDNVTSLAPQVNAGRIRALAVTSQVRSPLLPDVPTLAESGYPGFEATSWAGIMAPAGTPPDIVETLNRTINHVIGQPGFKARIPGGEVVPLSAASFATFVEDDRRQWGDTAKAIGLVLP